MKGLRENYGIFLILPLKDNRHLWKLKADGKYVQINEKNKVFNSQQYFINGAKLNELAFIRHAISEKKRRMERKTSFRFF